MQYPQTAYQDSLQSGISDAVLALTVTATAPTRTQGILTLGRIQSNREDIYYTNVVGNVVTVNLRGLSTTALTLTEVAGNKKVHAASESVEMTTHHNYDTNKARKDEADTISGDWTISGNHNFTAKPKMTGVKDSGGNEAIDIDATGSAVNQVRVINAIAGGNVIVTTAGDDADIDLELQAKGAGRVILEDGAQTKTNAAPAAETEIANKKYVDDQVVAVADTKVKASVTDTTASTLDNKQTVGTHLSITVVNPGANEQRRIDTDAIQSSAGAASANKLAATDANGVLDGTLTSFVATAGENITQGQPLCIQEVAIRFITGRTDTAYAWGDNATRGRVGWKFTPRVNVAFSGMDIRMLKTGAPVDNVTIAIETDSAGSPDGVSLGTSNNVGGGAIGATYAAQTFTWAAPVNLVAGTTYWFMQRRSGAVDAANYYRTSCTQSGNPDDVLNYYTNSERKTYDLNTATWGASSTTQIPWFMPTQSLGSEVIKTDADFFGKGFANFVGYADLTATTGNPVLINRLIGRNQSGLTPNTDYYISATAGALTTNIGADPALYHRKVARSLSTTTVAAILDHPTTKSVQTTRAAGAGTGAQTIAHKLGRMPNYIRITAYQDLGNPNITNSVGTAMPSESGTSFAYYMQEWGSAAASVANQDTNSIIYLVDGGGTNQGQATLTQVDDYNITLNWGTAVAGATALILIEVFG